MTSMPRRRDGAMPPQQRCQLLPALEPPTENDVLELDCVEDDDITFNFLISQEHDDDDIFVTLARAAQPVASAVSPANDESCAPSPPSSTLDMLDVCKCAAAGLDIPWPAAIARTTRSRYEGEDTPLGQERGEPTSPCLPRAVRTSDGARCCCPPPSQAVSDVLQEPTPALNVRPLPISADREDLQGHSD